MSNELVVLDGGIETDWIDPVISTRGTDDAWLVNNGHDVYEITKKPGRTVLERPAKETTP